MPAARRLRTHGAGTGCQWTRLRARHRPGGLLRYRLHPPAARLDFTTRASLRGPLEALAADLDQDGALGRRLAALAVLNRDFHAVILLFVRIGKASLLPYRVDAWAGRHFYCGF